MASTRPRRFDYVLLVESGPRDFAEESLRVLYAQGVNRLDLLTCYDTPPDSFDASRGEMQSVHAAEARADRRGFIRKLAKRPYSEVAILCVGSAVLQNWKWAIALQRVPRLVMIDEHQQLLRLRPGCANPLRKLLARRIAPTPNRDWDLPEAVLARIGVTLLIPFQLALLIAYTVKVHAARRMRLIFKQAPQS